MITETTAISDIIDDITTISNNISDMTHIPPDVRAVISEKLNYVIDELDRCRDEYGDEEESWDSCDEDETNYDFDYDYEND